MIKSQFIISAALVLGIVRSVCGMPYTGSVDAQRAGLYLVGSYGDFYVYGEPVTANLEASIDPAGPQITFDKYEIVMKPFTTTLTDSFPVGLGNNVTVKTTINFDQIVSDVDNWGPMTLTPESGGVYSITWPSLPTAMTTTVTGSYTVEGPTETKSGTFSKELRPHTATPPARWSLNATDYPSSVTLMNDNTLQWNATYEPYLITETVDALDVSVSMGGRYALFGDTVLSVPEPASLAMLGLGGLALIRRKRHIA